MPRVVYIFVGLTGLFYAMMVTQTKYWGVGSSGSQGVGGYWFAGLFALFLLQVMGKSTRVWSWWLLPVMGAGTHALFVAEPTLNGLLLEIAYLAAIAAALSWVAHKGT